MGDLPGWWNGRHAALRTQWPSWSCEFDSRLRHQISIRGQGRPSALVAQRTEQRTSTPPVPGSNPGGRSTEAHLNVPRWWNGRHAALRAQWPPRSCGFDSRLRHQHSFCGYSSSGRAPGFQPEGGRFEPDYPHQHDRAVSSVGRVPVLQTGSRWFDPSTAQGPVAQWDSTALAPPDFPVRIRAGPPRHLLRGALDVPGRLIRGSARGSSPPPATDIHRTAWPRWTRQRIAAPRSPVRVRVPSQSMAS